MAPRTDKKGVLVQGTLDMSILRTLQRGAGHGHDIARHIHQTTKDILRLEHGSLCPALHRLERRGLVAAKWELHKERKREFKYYRLTPAGRRQLRTEASRWQVRVEAIASVMQSEPAKEWHMKMPLRRRDREAELDREIQDHLALLNLSTHQTTSCAGPPRRHASKGHDANW